MNEPTPAPAARKKAPKRHRETPDFAAFLGRGIDALVERAVIDPAALVHFPELIERLRDGYNWALARSFDGADNYSLAELAAILDMSRPAVQQRVNKGRELIAAAESEAGVTRLRDSLGPVSVPALRDARAAAFEAAGVEDKRPGRHRKTA